MEAITVHCSATRENQHFSVNDIRDWHTAKGWSDVGYHYVITIVGEIQKGRPLTKTGAHTKGHNKNNIGICLIGGLNEHGEPADTFTVQQYASLRYLISDLAGIHGIPIENIKGHRDYPDVHKECPCFDVQDKLQEWAI